MGKDLSKHSNFRKGSQEHNNNDSKQRNGTGNKSCYLNELELLRRIKGGDERAFDSLFYKYKGKIYHFLKLSLPDDHQTEGIVQEVFIRLWLKRKEINVSQGIQPFLFSIARNLMRDQLRKNLVRQKYLSSLSFTQNEVYSSPEREMEYAEFEKRVMDYIENMPERRRHIFELSRNEGKTYLQIANELGISVNTVDTQIRKALHGLRSLILKVVTCFF
nr:RNA polymerase sigma-70 factor [uncultured Draconibacterium sp.]